MPLCVLFEVATGYPAQMGIPIRDDGESAPPAQAKVRSGQPDCEGPVGPGSRHTLVPVPAFSSLTRTGSPAGTHTFTQGVSSNIVFFLKAIRNESLYDSGTGGRVALREVSR